MSDTNFGKKMHKPKVIQSIDSRIQSRNNNALNCWEWYDAVKASQLDNFKAQLIAEREIMWKQGAFDGTGLMYRRTNAYSEMKKILTTKELNLIHEEFDPPVPNNNPTQDESETSTLNPTELSETQQTENSASPDENPAGNTINSSKKASDK